MNPQIYDVECIGGVFFSVVFCDAGTEQIHEFVIHDSRNDIDALLIFLHTPDLKLVGFNCNNYDGHLLEYLWKLKRVPSVQQVLSKLTKISEDRINSERDYYGEFSIPHRDLMSIWHFNNPGRMASLKWLQINMGFKNVEDMPFDHKHQVLAHEIPMILSYNKNDVMATLELYNRSKGKFKLRKAMSAKYGVDMSNFPDTKIGKYILLKMLSNKTFTSIQALKQCKTPRSAVPIKDVILPQIKFESKEFTKLLEYYNNLTWKKDEELPEILFRFDSLDYYFGIGGLHAARDSGIYSDISSADVTGYYPSLAVAQKFAPAHFGQDFVDVYGAVAEERKTYGKGTDENVSLKLASNGAFGDSNNEFSPWYDPKFFLQITINGQLSLAMLCERLTLAKAATVLMANTDGIEVEIIDKTLYEQICKEWQSLFGITLEHIHYKFIALRDVNNYLAVKDSGEVKLKGVFVTSPELHQDHSMLIVPKAIEKFLVNGIPVQQTIMGTTKIDDFLMGIRAKTGHFTLKTVENNEVIEKPLPRHIRYYVSNKGSQMIKYTEKKRDRVHPEAFVMVFNQWIDGPYDIDRNFYIVECQKILRQLKPRKITKFEQTSLW